jgi:hypothetical protein
VQWRRTAIDNGRDGMQEGARPGVTVPSGCALSSRGGGLAPVRDGQELSGPVLGVDNMALVAGSERSTPVAYPPRANPIGAERVMHARQSGPPSRVGL